MCWLLNKLANGEERRSHRKEGGRILCSSIIGALCLSDSHMACLRLSLPKPTGHPYVLVAGHMLLDWSSARLGLCFCEGAFLTSLPL